MRTRFPAVVAAVLAAIALLGACNNGATEGGGVATLGEQSASTGQASDDGDDKDDDKGDGEAKDPQEAAVEFARCMREHGVDMPDPEVDESGRTRMRVTRAPGSGASGGMSDDEFEEADEACRPILEAGRPQLSDEQRQELQDAMLAYAKCMREHGIDMPDPDPGRRGLVVQAGPGRNPAFDPESEEFEAAHRACQKHMEGIDRELGVTRERR